MSDKTAKNESSNVVPIKEEPITTVVPISPEEAVGYKTILEELNRLNAERDALGVRIESLRTSANKMAVIRSGFSEENIQQIGFAMDKGEVTGIHVQLVKDQTTEEEPESVEK